MKSDDLKVKLALCTTVFFWASAFIGIRVSLDSYSPGAVAFLRYFIASLLMIYFYLKLPKRNTPTLKEGIRIFICGFLGIGCYNVFLNYGEVTVSPGIASFLVGTMPIFTIILAMIFLSEKMTGRKWLGVLVSFVGVILIAIAEQKAAPHPKVGHLDMGVIYTIMAAILGSLYAILQKPLLTKFHPIEITAFAIWSGTIAMIGFLPGSIAAFPHSTLTSNLWLLYLGIFPATVAYATWSYALSKIPASSSTTYLYGMPILSMGMSYLILNEVPMWLSIAGGLTALLGSFIACRKKRVIIS
jgi:drug/metabolite transporter (DMT)-like permease